MIEEWYGCYGVVCGEWVGSSGGAAVGDEVDDSSYRQPLFSLMMMLPLTMVALPAALMSLRPMPLLIIEPLLRTVCIMRVLVPISVLGRRMELLMAVCLLTQ